MIETKDELKYVLEDMQWEKLPKEQLERVLKLWEVPLPALLERYAKSQSYGENGKVLHDDYYDVPIFLRILINAPSAREVNESLDSIKTLIENLEAKFRNHRHETGKTFSAKPEY